MKKFLTLFFLIAIINNCFPCDCKEINDIAKAQKESYENHELIFIGEVINSDDSSNYTLRVVELFKGQHDISIIVGKVKSYCSLVPGMEDGLWLVYANPDSDGTIDIQDCGLSRSYKYPYLFSKDLAGPPPPPKTYKDETLDRIYLEQRVIESKRKALDILKTEIINLRKK